MKGALIPARCLPRAVVTPYAPALINYGGIKVVFPAFGVISP